MCCLSFASCELVQYVPKWFVSHPLVHDDAANKLHALLLPAMTTLHDHDLPDFASLDCRVDRNNDAAHLITAAELIVWDEAPMMHKHVYGYLDRVLHDITRVDALSGGKVAILGGDFRQIPTIIQKGSRGQVCEASLKRAYFWPVMKQMELKINMRVQSLAGVYTWPFAAYNNCDLH